MTPIKINEFKYLGTWGDSSGLSNIVTIYNELFPAFDLRMTRYCPGHSGLERDNYYKVAKVITNLLNAGMEAKPELLKPFLEDGTNDKD